MIGKNFLKFFFLLISFSISSRICQPPPHYFDLQGLQCGSDPISSKEIYVFDDDQKTIHAQTNI